jgi:hypothetical protein
VVPALRGQVVGTATDLTMGTIIVVIVVVGVVASRAAAIATARMTTIVVATSSTRCIPGLWSMDKARGDMAIDEPHLEAE